MSVILCRHCGKRIYRYPFEPWRNWWVHFGDDSDEISMSVPWCGTSADPVPRPDGRDDRE